MVWLLLHYVILYILGQQILLDPQVYPLYETVTYYFITLSLGIQLLLAYKSFKSV